MVDMGSIASAVTSLKVAFDITSAVIELKAGAEVQGKILELQRVINAAQKDAFTAQSEQFALANRVRELEKEIASLKAWDTEKQRYQLKQIDRGAFAYALKEEAANGEPPHWICQACYERGTKSILQAHRNDDRRWDNNCPTCKVRIVTIGLPSFDQQTAS